ncbi:SusC/RagA family TonB-linked outer membrane protein [Chitinophaga sp. XS-30]|uniref:SusC/RagA family TonB-linked outer membrane protein n=1 Tax=Chitinophaga sp. XS-30 TaxID=2604421 RepID=UPI0011DD5015|nr:SusC/RagA family TonB-linked outer membrane protein [Chitinophaga sp. XS-30]QEH42955.1 SusC/RagA family TonB-linked outer membrane protein [Chitinophaga sp. XS-30]
MKRSLHRKGRRGMLKALFVLVFLSGLQLTVVARGKGQDKRLDVHVNNASLETVFDIVRKQSSYLFMFRDENLAGLGKKVTLRLKDATIEQVMERCLENSPLTYRIVDNTVILVRRTGADVQPQPVRLTGMVKDATNGEPLPGVTVSVKGTTNGTLTDAAGQFALDNVNTPAVLVFSYIGFTSQSIDVGDRKEFLVQLQRESRSMQQVVVVGYGTQQKTELTGSIGTFRPNELNARPVLGPDQLLQGRIAGVNVSSSSGMPGSAVRVSVRGIGSLSASNEPLYVIDGVPLIPHSADMTSLGTPMNQLSQLNPNDIASIEVLKDASSAAIYGSRATNGVVLITTKSGRKGSGQLAINAWAGMQEVPNLRKIKMASSEQYLEVVNEAIDNYNLQYGYMPGNSRFIPGVDHPYPGLPDTDWANVVMRKAYTQNIDLSVSGGNDKTTYYISGGMLNQQGTVITNDLKKYSGRINLTTEPLSWLRTGINVSFSYSDNNRVPGSNIGSTVMGRSIPQRPFDRPYKPDGSYYVGGTPDLVYHNPLQILNEEVANLKNYRLLGNAFAEVKFTPELTYKTSFGSDIGYTHDYIYYNQKHPYGTGNGRIVDESRLLTNLLLENTLSYSRTFGELKVDLLGGHSFQRLSVSTTGIDGNGFPAPSFDVLAAASVINNASTNLYGNAMESYFGRANLAWKGRYLFGASIRTDGSSRFSPDNRYGYFPSVSGGWLVSREPFWTMPRTDLKLRLSYGSTGNQEGVSNYAYQSLTGGGYNYNEKSGIAITGFGNNTLTWEKANQFDAGMDLGLMGGAVNLTLDYFRKNTTNLLYNMPIPGTSGFTSITSNIGSMLNHGLEAAVSTNLTFGKLSWSSDFNIAFVKNRITSLIGNNDVLSIGGNRALQVGYDIGSIWVYRMTGIFQDDKDVPEPLHTIGVRAGDVQYEDVNSDGKIDINDRQIVGSSNPDFYGGWNNTFRYRNFDLSVFLNYMYGQEVYATYRITIDRLGQNAVNVRESVVKDRWTGPGTSNTVPRAIYSHGYNLYNSSRWMEDGSFLRVRTVSLGYELPSSWLSRIKVSRLRLYLQADNLWLLTGYSGLDPEVSANMDPRFIGEDNLVLPQPRSFNAGINLNF